MRKAGRIKSWNADKGYGFIEVHAQSKDVFLHVSSLQNRSAVPRAGDRVSFEITTSKEGRPQASRVSIAGAPRQAAAQASAQASLLPAVTGAFALATVIGIALAGYLPRGVALLSLALSVTVFALYAMDKGRAARREWRVPEANLHLLALFGGWPGALAAQHLFRHKNQKREFQFIFRATVALNVGAMILWITAVRA
ncbi:DUF1294 domain-containing protein [Cupriavidus sp. 2TAF22]|uniref:DUF1294 domain-containing protein n=1 Tax=unclassified Cupriavidus TaxID=2640874 RepID=UPI003F9121BC